MVRVLQYHELKVRRGRAECLYAANFIKEANELSYRDKLYHFERLMSRNELAVKKVIHTFLRFGVADRLSNETIIDIAKDYARAMGFDHQPWLLYLHRDTLHPHVHIVSTSIQQDGIRIPLTLDDLKLSRKVTHRLERKYSLDTRDYKHVLREGTRKALKPIQYGEQSLYPAMEKVLAAIVPAYKYTDLAEFNALLRPYHIEATRGREQSLTYQHGGLLFFPLSEDGRRQGAYIKASAFESRPTLQNLEQKFKLNQSLREQDRVRFTTAIDWAFYKKSPDLQAFREALGRQRINTVLQRDKTGELKEIFYVDHEAKIVFDGKALGTRYTAEGINQRCVSETVYREQQQLLLNQQRLQERPRLRMEGL
jgi:hypothetical protein